MMLWFVPTSPVLHAWTRADRYQFLMRCYWRQARILDKGCFAWNEV